MSIYEHGTSGLALTWDSGDQVEKEQCAHYPWAHNGIQDEEFAPVNGHLYMSAGSKLRETLDEMNDPSKDGCADGAMARQVRALLGQMVDDRSAKDGPGVEAIVAGKACGSLLAVTATEKQGTAFVYGHLQHRLAHTALREASFSGFRDPRTQAWPTPTAPWARSIPKP